MSKVKKAKLSIEIVNNWCLVANLNSIANLDNVAL